MSRITATIPTAMGEALDAVATELNSTRSQVVRAALERYLEDHDDLTVAMARLRDSGDSVLEWDEVKPELV